MKLLVISPSFPSPTWGAGTRNYYLLKALVRQHTVTLLALVNRNEIKNDRTLSSAAFGRPTRVIVRPEGHYKRIQQLVDVLRGRSYVLGVQFAFEMQRALDELLLQEQYDAVLFESVLIAGYHLPAHVKMIIDQHNIEYELLHRSYEHETSWLRRWYNKRESQILKPIEFARCRKADAVLVTSERERLSLKRAMPNKLIEVVPNGVDLQVFQSDGLPASQEVPGRIVFTGAMDYYPNTDAVLCFARQCWPRIQTEFPEATWYIVGRNPSPEVWRLGELQGVTVTGSVPDVRPYLAAACVAIVPLQVGSGTRLKILEALAMQKAVVSTSVGCEGLQVCSGKHLLVVDQPEAFGNAVLDLLCSPEKRRQLELAGRVLAETEYSWESSGTKLLRVLDEI